jgi:hypothetical protein
MGWRRINHTQTPEPIVERDSRRLQPVLPASPPRRHRYPGRRRLWEMPVSRLLFGVRSLPARLAGRRGLPSRSGVPLLDQFLDRGFVLLVDVPGEELAAGVIGQMWRRGGRMVIPGDREEFVAFAEPGFVKAALTFRFIGRADGTTLAETETRVAATDPAARRGFGRYWLLVRGFSGLIRRDWLWVVARRAERG